MKKQIESGGHDLVGKKEETESLLLGGSVFACQRISPSQSTLHIIM